PGQAEFGALGLLRPQVRVAEERVVQLVESRRLERGAVAGAEPPAIGELHAPGRAAGGVAAELLVVVATHAGLQRLRTETPLVLRERGAVAALAFVVGGAAGDAVAQPVDAGAEQ